MKKIISLIVNLLKIESIKLFLVKNITTFCFKVIAKSKSWNENNYDLNVIELYKGVRIKQAFFFKVKIVAAGKGVKHHKILFLETPSGNIETKLMKSDHPLFFKTEPEILNY